METPTNMHGAHGAPGGTVGRERTRLDRSDLARVSGGRGLSPDAAAFIWSRSRPEPTSPSRPVTPWR